MDSNNPSSSSSSSSSSSVPNGLNKKKSKGGVKRSDTKQSNPMSIRDLNKKKKRTEEKVDKQDKELTDILLNKNTLEQMHECYQILKGRYRSDVKIYKTLTEEAKAKVTRKKKYKYQEVYDKLDNLKNEISAQVLEIQNILDVDRRVELRSRFKERHQNLKKTIDKFRLFKVTYEKDIPTIMDKASTALLAYKELLKLIQLLNNEKNADVKTREIKDKRTLLDTLFDKMKEDGEFFDAITLHYYETSMTLLPDPIKQSNIDDMFSGFIDTVIQPVIQPEIPPVIQQEYPPEIPPVIQQEYPPEIPPVIQQEYQPEIQQEYPPEIPPVIQQEYPPEIPPVIQQETNEDDSTNYRNLIHDLFTHPPSENDENNSAFEDFFHTLNTP